MFVTICAACAMRQDRLAVRVPPASVFVQPCEWCKGPAGEWWLCIGEPRQRRTWRQRLMDAVLRLWWRFAP